ncbi:MAG: hypothetical protein F6K19_48455 [Cyanothece sp. SIO1E1]|nr:hypothetical protein [Cyanothece sp. SIO1E1]
MHVFCSIDENGYFIEQVVLDSLLGVDLTLLIEAHPPAGLYKGWWNGEQWLERATPEEIQAIIDAGNRAPRWQDFYEQFRATGLESILQNSADTIGLMALVSAFTASETDPGQIAKMWNRVIASVPVSVASLTLIEQLLSDYQIPFQINENGVVTIISET